MALTTVTYDSFFNYNLATKTISFTDTTDYTGQGSSDVDVTVVAKVEAPISGVFYNNTNHGDPDIDPDVSRDSLHTIALPTGVDGLPEQGLYTITLQYDDDGSTSGTPVVINEVKTFTLDYSSPTAQLEMTVDCITPLLSSNDVTSYTINGVDPTIVRAMEINYPASMQLPSVTGTANLLSTRTFYYVTGQTIEHSGAITANLTYDFSNGFYVIDEVSGSEFVGVACDGDICDIYCCIRSQWQRYEAAKTNNAVLATKELSKFNNIMSLTGLVGAAVKCGKSSQVSEYVEEILAIAECDAGCSCDDGTPQLVTGLAINGNDVIVAEGTGIQVDEVTGGGTTTYTVSISSENITKLANMTASIVDAGTNVSVATNVVVVNGIPTTTYTVTATDVVVESSFVKAMIEINTSTVPTITIETQAQYGSTFSTVNQTVSTEFIKNENDASFTDWATKSTDFTIANFGTAVGDFFPEVEVVNIVGAGRGDYTSWSNKFKANITTMGTDTFSIRINDEDGNNINGNFLQTEFLRFELIFKIQA